LPVLPDDAWLSTCAAHSTGQVRLQPGRQAG